MSGPLRVTVLASTGRLGRTLVRQLRAAGHEIVAVGRDPAKLAALPPGIETRIADFGDAPALAAALVDAGRVASCANAQYLPTILAALPPSGVERLVVMGSTRCFSRVPDVTAEAVRRAEALLATCPVPSVMLLATLIYGGGGGVVESLVRQIRRCPVLPLPGGGSARVQPIHVEDVAACLAAALLRPDAPGPPIVIAGPTAMRYRAMVEAIARARGLRVMVLPLPGAPFAAAARLAPPGPIARIAGSFARLLEDKAFDIAEMCCRLGVEPRDFAP